MFESYISNTTLHTFDKKSHSILEFRERKVKGPVPYGQVCEDETLALGNCLI